MDEQLDPAARQLITEHLGLVSALARKHRNWNSPDRAPVEDLIAEGNLALCLAAKTWDPARGPFAVHATVMVNRALAELDQAWARPVRIPRQSLVLLRKIRQARLDGANTPEKAAQATGINIKNVTALWPHLATGSTNIEEAGEIPDKDTPENAYAEASEPQEEHERVRAAVSALPRRQRLVIQARFGWATGTPMIAKEVAEHLGLTLEQVADAETRAWNQLRKALL